MLWHSTRRHNTKQSGVILITLALALIPIIAVVALLVDLGNGMRQQTALKTALDAGALRGAKALMEKKSTNQASTVAREVVRSNLIARGFSTELSEKIVEGLQITYSNNKKITVDASHAYHVFFAGVLNGVGNSLSVGAESSATYVRGSEDPKPIPTSYTLVVDKSGSMHQTLESGEVKMEALKSAMNWMVQNSTLDEFAFIAFAGTCNESTGGYLDVTAPAQKESALQWIANLDYIPNMKTKMACGPKRAYSYLPNAKHKRRIVILLSDGEPTHGINSGDGCCGHKDGATVCWADKIKTDFSTPVYTIGFGDLEVRTFDPVFLNRVAGTGPAVEGGYGCNTAEDAGPQTDPPGKYLELPDGKALQAAFGQLLGEGEEGESRYFLTPAPSEK